MSKQAGNLNFITNQIENYFCTPSPQNKRRAVK